MKTWAEMAAEERDALVAVEVMGAEWHNITPAGRKKELRLGGRRVAVMEYGTLVVFGAVGKPELPPYTTDIAAAWGVVDKMRADDFWCGLAYKTDFYRTGEDAPGWEAHFRCVRAGTRGDHIAFVATAPEAICLAALRARGLDL